jgi:hypothetical protein
MNTALAALASLAASCDEDYTNDDENKPENENESMDYNVDEPSVIME